MKPSSISGIEYNMCDWIHCENGGTCQSRENSKLGFQCHCNIGFHGLLCQNQLTITSKRSCIIRCVIVFMISYL